MFFDTDRCLQCGTYDRPTKLNTEYASHIKPDGSLWYTGYWVCSDECFNDAIFSMMPKEYWPAHYHTIDEHPKIKALRRDLEEKYEEDAGYHQAEYDIEAKRIWQEFTKERAEVHRATSRKFINHVTAKWNLEQKKRAEQERVEAQKEADRQQREQDRVEERNRRELEQQMRERKKIEEEHHRREAYEKMIATKPIPEARRFEHTHILGPSGSGKTTLIQQIILDDLAKPDPPAYIVIDPKGELVWRLSHLNVFSLHHVGKSPPGRLAERLVIIDPELRPALNVFQETEGKPAQIVSTFSYVFSTTRQSLTGKQATCFSFCVRLLFTIPGSNLFTLLDLLEDEQADPRFKNAISNLTKPSEAAARRFFQYDFYSKNYSATRQEIRTRIWEVLQDEYLFTMLNADERTIDIAQCIREHKIVLVNTRMAELKLAHQTLGRYILALAVNALQARAGTPKSTWHPTFIVIDEFQEFADEHKTPEMLRLIREYNGGVIIAHHNMYPTEFNDGIRSAISTNTAIKYASNPAGMDIGYMARDMHCEPEFLTRTCVKTATHARFGCFVTGMEHPFLVEVPFLNIEKQPQMPEILYRCWLEIHKIEYGVTQEPSKTPEAPMKEGSDGAAATKKARLPKASGPPAADPHTGEHTEPASKWGS